MRSIFSPKIYKWVDGNLFWESNKIFQKIERYSSPSEIFFFPQSEEKESLTIKNLYCIDINKRIVSRILRPLKERVSNSF